jgi:glycosyltransferase involved in cell wall biosynthesis
VHELVEHLDHHLPARWRIVIADNASTDDTWEIAQHLAATIPGVEAQRLDCKGRGRALKAAWLASPADVVAYMDIDLSTNLHSFLPLIAPLLSGHSQVAVGNRLMKGSRTTRQWKRELLSRGYNLLIRVGFRPQFTDAQCGFKALRADVARQLLPHVRDTGWFFDTELLLLADRAGHRIFDVPVDWIEDLDSRVHIPSTVRSDLAGLWRMRLAFWRGQDVSGDAPEQTPDDPRPALGRGSAPATPTDDRRVTL